MMESKLLKKLPHKERSTIYLWWIESKIGRFYYRMISKFIIVPIHHIKKTYSWYTNVFRHDYDFDGQCLFAIIEYKLKRLEKCLIDGYAFQSEKEMKALRIAIKISGRLKDDKYESIAYDRHDKKWGNIKTWLTPVNDESGNSYFNSSRPNANTPEEKEQERKDFSAHYESAHIKMKKEEKLLYAILHKYLRFWWD